MSSEMPNLPTAGAREAAPAGYGEFLLEIKGQIRRRQYQALRAANRELIELYWWLGESISRRQAEQGWGKSVVETLARDLQAEFPGRNGFSSQNLWLMRQFFNEYSQKPKLQSLIGEISWAVGLRCANPTYGAGDTSLKTTESAIGTPEATKNAKETPKKHQRNAREDLLNRLREEPSLSVKALAELSGNTPASVRHHLRALQATGRIRHFGPNKSGYWKILDGESDGGAGV